MTMAKDPLSKAIIKTPFRQREYIKMMRNKIEAVKRQTRIISPEQRDALLEELYHMTEVLIEDLYLVMNQELPQKYYKMIGGHTGEVCGTCTDPDDVFAEEPKYKVIEITKEEWEALDDNE